MISRTCCQSWCLVGLVFATVSTRVADGLELRSSFWDEANNARTRASPASTAAPSAPAPVASEELTGVSAEFSFASLLESLGPVAAHFASKHESKQKSPVAPPAPVPTPPSPPVSVMPSVPPKAHHKAWSPPKASSYPQKSNALPMPNVLPSKGGGYGMSVKPPAPSKDVATARTCREGFQMTADGKRCMSQILKPFERKCPPGSQIIGDGTCGALVDPQLGCPSGFKLAGGQCLNIINIPPSEECPAGTIPSRNSPHLCRSSDLTLPTCPSQYTLDGAFECTTKADPVQRCPPGFQLSAGKCLRSVDPQPVCPSPYLYDPKTRKCEMVVPGSPRCPAGFEMTDSDQCMRHLSSLPGPCPSGTQPSLADTSKCESIEVTDPTYSCPSGAALDGTSCSTVSYKDRYCPAGFTEDSSSGNCVKRAPRQSSCPDGWDKVNSGGGLYSCRKITYYPMDPECPDGYDLVGEKCKHMELSRPSYQCPPGYQEYDHGCVSKRVVPKRYVCPDGYDLVAVGVDGAGKNKIEIYVVNDAPSSNVQARCVQFYTEDCSIKTFKEECKPDYYMPNAAAASVSYKNDVYNSNPSIYGFSASGNEGTAEYGKVKCDRVEVIIPKTCDREDIQAPQSTCPEYATPNGKGDCEVEEVIDKLMVCRPGEHMGQNGECFRIIGVPVNYQCPEGLEPAPGGQKRCMDKLEDPADMYCPDGYEMEVEVAVKQYKVQPKTLPCVQTVDHIDPPSEVSTFPADPACNRGVLRGNACMEKVFVPRPHECPAYTSAGKPSSSDKQCIQVMDPVPGEQSVSAVDPTFKCPGGTPLGSDQKCTKITDERVAVCPVSFIPQVSKGGTVRCLKGTNLLAPTPTETTVPKIYSCPEGFSPEGEYAPGRPKGCVFKEAVAPCHTCPSGFSASNILGLESKCARLQDPVLSCPPGCEATSDGCVTRKYAAPIITLVRTCRAGDPGCEAYNFQGYSFAPVESSG